MFFLSESCRFEKPHQLDSWKISNPLKWLHNIWRSYYSWGVEDCINSHCSSRNCVFLHSTIHLQSQPSETPQDMEFACLQASLSAVTDQQAHTGRELSYQPAFPHDQRAEEFGWALDPGVLDKHISATPVYLHFFSCRGSANHLTLIFPFSSVMVGCA